MKTKFDESALTANQIHIGSKAHEAFLDGQNPPSWVEDEDTWAKAKESALKSYDLDDDAYWPVVTHIYEAMGGDVTSALANGDKPGHEFRGNAVTGGRASSSAASSTADKATAKAQASDSPEDHEAARDAHRQAEARHRSEAVRARNKGDDDKADAHNSARQRHKALAEWHNARAQDTGADRADKTADRREALQNDRAVQDGPNWRLCIENEAIGDDGWALAAPFGEHLKVRKVVENGRVIEQRFLQVLDNEAADALLAKENSFFRKLKRSLVGIPVYKGHPDLADYAPETLGNQREKKEVIGVVDQVRKGSRGIDLHFALTPRGADAVENEGCKYPSILWLVLPNGNRMAADGQPAIAVRPFKLVSAGLTPYPNISGVESLANAGGAGSPNNTEPDMKLIAGWLLAQGAVLANADAPNEMQVLEAFKTLHTSQAGQVTALGNEKQTLAGQITKIENERTIEKKRADTNATALANAETARKVERAGRAEAVTDLAIAKGKLAVAGRDQQIAALENAADFAVEAAKLLSSATQYRMTGADVQSGKVLANQTEDVTAEYNKQFSEALKTTGGDPIKAHAIVVKLPGMAQRLAPKRGI